METFDQKQERELKEFKEHQAREAQYHKELEEAREKQRKEREEFHNSQIKYICEEYGFNEKVAEIIYSKAWEEGHSFGYNDVRCYIDNFAEFAEELFKTK